MASLSNKEVRLISRDDDFVDALGLLESSANNLDFVLKMKDFRAPHEKTVAGFLFSIGPKLKVELRQHGYVIWRVVVQRKYHGTWHEEAYNSSDFYLRIQVH
jgi:hypothetical protein